MLLKEYSETLSQADTRNKDSDCPESRRLVQNGILFLFRCGSDSYTKRDGSFIAESSTTSVIGTANDGGLEEDSQDALHTQRLDKRLEVVMGYAFIVVELHVVHVGKLRLGHERVALSAGVLVGGTNDHG